MKIVVLGAGTAIPSPGYSPAGIYLKAGREHVLFDAGPGTLQRLQAIGVNFLQLDRLFLTHYHLDHCLDLASLLFAMRLPQPARTTPFTVYGPGGLTQLYRRLNRAFHGWLEPRTYRLKLRELDATRLRLPGYTVEAARMRHSAPALGYRLTAGGKTVVYSGDTDVCADIIRLGRKADLLVLECSMPDARKVTGHLTPSECGRIAAAAECRRLVLTHFYPVFQGTDIRSRVHAAFRGRLRLARDGTVLRV